VEAEGRLVTVAESLARWADGYVPDSRDLALAQRSLLDTVAVTLAARGHPLREMTAGLPDAVRWAALGHVLDFDDLHAGSTTHISAVVVPAVLAAGGGTRAYLAGAGVMARLGMMLGWPHYAAGWHATCTAGAPAAAAAAGAALGLPPGRLAAAMALAVPAAGGVQAAFGTHGKSLQVGFAAGAGVRAARLAAAGATADPRALDDWLALVGGTAGPVAPGGPAVPGGLAVKLFPCCYAMQRPIAALRAIREQIGAEEVVRVRVATPESATRPLIHDQPRTGLEGKFSMPYAVAAALLDGYPGLASFTDTAVSRPAAQRIMSVVKTDYAPGGSGLLDGEVAIEVELGSGRVVRTRLAQPPGSPLRPPGPGELDGKLAACGQDVPGLLDGLTWEAARALLRRMVPPGEEVTA
jgi:2-methylcitrate dehydratase PrpD